MATPPPAPAAPRTAEPIDQALRLLHSGRYVTTAQAAALRGVHRRTVDHWLAQGWLDYWWLQVGQPVRLVRRADVLAFDPPPRGPTPADT
jgi:hypothetical protein